MLILTRLLLISGVCVAADLTVNGSVGGTVELPSDLGSLKVEDFQMLRWKFKNIDIAEKLSGQTEVNLHAQFKRRLQLSPDFSLTVRELRLEDSGEYQRLGRKKDGSQISTYTIQLQVYEPITSVWIQPEYTWDPENHSCAVHLVCNSSGGLRPSYTWRMRDQTESSSRLHFFLPPGEGNVTITCTAVNAANQMSSNHTVRCIPTETQPDWKLYLYTAVPAGVSLLCVIIVSLVCHFRRRAKAADTSQEEITTYAVVNKVGRSQSTGLENPVSLYETVGDVNIPEMTVYSTVQKPRPPHSPYIEAL
ncbi:signaling lymphocytic activation molecule-like [Brienomyrus brachyistius]|uniref:signaling lymphocytic activation molecule-like n=1 Tax=Brienomyrus brachyistius TaxID=42636 RepID=UPI0020B2A153|nr:signaling lymphocytic activation molecule-like [Brienomyrus brachyistius]